MKTYPRSRACIECRGACCRHDPGAAAPEDFGHDVGRVFRALASGLWVLDWIGPRQLYVRPRSVDERGIFQGPTLAPHGRCVFLSRRGCRLSRKPLACRMLKPSRSGCQQFARYGDVVSWWRDWRPVFLALHPKPRPYTIEEAMRILFGREEDS